MKRKGGDAGLVALATAACFSLAGIVGSCSQSNADGPPRLETFKEAVPLAACETAQVRLRVTGTGDPVTERLPLDVMLVLDRSGSINTATMADIKNHSNGLIDQLDAGIDRAGMSSFSTAATLNAALTSDFPSVKSAINALAASGNTNLGGGVFVGQQELAARGGAPPTVRVMVVLTDGVANRTTSGASCSTTPTAANACTQDAVNQAAAAKAAGTVVYTIGLNLAAITPAAAQNLARTTLRTMASSPDKYFEAPTSAALQGVFNSIATSVTAIAGANVVLTDILPPAVHYVSGSATPAPATVNGKTLTWNLGLVSIGQTVDVAFNVGLNPFARTQLVGVFPDSRVDYTDYQGVAASAAFPATYVSALSCSTCGDGILGSGEECDDANTNSGDCCSEDCTLEPRGTPCDDGLTCTLDDQCDGSGVCRGGAGGTTSAGVYALLSWSMTDPPGSAMTTIGGRTLINGNVCAESIRARSYSRVTGDEVALLPSGTAITFGKETSVAGSVTTAGGLISGLNDVRVLSGRVDTAGTAPEFQQCLTAREQATAKYAELKALAPSPGLEFGPVEVKGKQTWTIPADGNLDAGEVVIRINGDLKLRSFATLTINGAPSTTRVIVRILGKLVLRGRARIELNGLTPAQVVYLVDGAVRAGGYSAIAGTVWGGSSITLSGRNVTDGAVLGRSVMSPRSLVIINRRPWVGWCD